MRGSRGLAESYADGLWDSPDLVAVIRLAARNAVAASTACARSTAPLLDARASAARAAAPPHAGSAAGATSPRTTTSATSCSRGCSTRR